MYAFNFYEYCAQAAMLMTIFFSTFFLINYDIYDDILLFRLSVGEGENSQAS